MDFIGNALIFMTTCSRVILFQTTKCRIAPFLQGCGENHNLRVSFGPALFLIFSETPFPHSSHLFAQQACATSSSMLALGWTLGQRWLQSGPGLQRLPAPRDTVVGLDKKGDVTPAQLQQGSLECLEEPENPAMVFFVPNTHECFLQERKFVMKIN